jgi:hypothetical protein
MKTLEQFEKYYQKELKPEIGIIEKEGEKVKRRYSFKSYAIDMATFAIIITIIAITRDFVPVIPEFVIPVCILLTVLYGIIKPIYIFIKRNLVFDEFNQKYKETVAKKLLNFIDPELNYEPSCSLPVDKFLVRTFYLAAKWNGNLRSEDLVSGKFDNRNFLMVDAHVSLGKDNSDSAFGDRTTFDGVYAIVTLKNYLNGTMHLNYINEIMQPLSEVTEGIESFRAQMFQALGGLTGKDPAGFDHRFSPGYIQVETGDDSFQKMFKVIALETGDGEEILTEKFRKGLQKIAEESGKKIGLTFTGNELHIALTGENLFETDVHANISDKESRFSTQNYFRIFETIDRLIRLVD